MHSTSSVPLKQKHQKYNKITQQKKFHLLNLIFKERLPIREAATIAGINYLTAKTILFFHKNNCKSYRFDINRTSESKPAASTTAASYSTIRKITDINQKLIKPKSRIEVICSIGNVLSPPKVEQVPSPTTCSNCQDSLIIKPPPLSLQKNNDLSFAFPANLVGQEYNFFDLQQLMFRRAQASLEKDIILPQKMTCEHNSLAQIYPMK